MGKSTKKHEKAGDTFQKIDSHTSDNNQNSKLAFWQDKYKEALSKYEQDLHNIDKFFEVYNGTGDIYNTKGVKAAKGTSSVRKVVFELIESQVDVNIPMPKVTSLSGNEARAMTVEHYIRNEIDRLPFETIVDEQARTTPIAGASFFLVEWDNAVTTRNTVGKMKVTNLDPKSVIPQPGISAIDNMDYIFVRMLQTKLDIKNRYDIDINKLQESEQTEPDMDETNNDELVTHIYCYYKDDKGQICLFSWVDDLVINDLDNYFARKEYVCEKCGKSRVEQTEKCDCGSRKFKLKDV